MFEPSASVRTFQQTNLPRLIARPIALALAVSLALGVAARASAAPLPGSVQPEWVASALIKAKVSELGSSGDAEAPSQLVRQLVLLDERLALNTFPDGSGLWLARLAASLEYMVENSQSPGAPASDLMNRLALQLRSLGVDVGLDGSPGAEPPESPSRERAERLRRLRETVRLIRDKLDRLEVREVGERNDVFLAPLVAPVHDDCSSALVIAEGTVTGSTTDATPDGSSACDSSPGALDVWFRFTASEARAVTFDTYGSSYDTLLSIHDACPGDQAAMELGCADDSGGTLQSELTLNLVANEEVWVRVAGFGGSSGSFQLNVGRPRGISGTITRADTGEPLSGATVKLWTEGSFLGEYVTGVDGTYMFGSLTDGFYYISVSAPGMITEVYKDILCPSYIDFCDAAYSGTSIEVNGDVTTGIDVALDLAGAVSGKVTDAISGEPVAAFIDLYSATGGFLDSFYTGSGGTYEINQLSAGKYYLVVEASNHQNELYDDIPCQVSCDVTTGVQLAILDGATLSGVDFALDPFGEMIGTLTEATTGDPIVGEPVWVHSSPSSNGDSLGYTDSNGTYRIGSLAPGSYLVRTSTDAYRDEIYDDIPCEPYCDISAGAAVDVALSATTSGIDFALDRLGEINGTIVDEQSGQPRQYVSVGVYDETGRSVRSSSTGSDGSYRIEGLQPGAYFVMAHSSSYQDEIFDDVPCVVGACDVTTGTPITTGINLPVSAIDFSLVPLGSISGTVTDNVSGDPIVGAYVGATHSNGASASSTRTDESGSYTLEPLPTGDYFVLAKAVAHRGEVFDDVPCSSQCSLLSGTPISVSPGITRSGVDFALDRSGVITGVVVGADTQSPLQHSIEVFNELGQRVYPTFSGGSSGYRVEGLPEGTYFLKAVYGNGGYGDDRYQDELYDGVPCEPTCDVAKGVAIPLKINTTVAGVNFILSPCPADTFSDVLGTIFLSIHTQEACERLTAGAGTTITSGADVTFTAGRSIVLRDGFRVKQGATFRAVIEPTWADD